MSGRRLVATLAVVVLEHLVELEAREPETPILLLHGTGDWRVSPLQALRMP